MESSFFVGESTLDSYVEKNIVQNTDIASTEKEAVVQARLGQGLFRENLKKFEVCCRITGVEDQRLLIASHVKPWRSCQNNHERLDGNNGLLLTPTMDKLFDRRYLTFEDNGDVVLSKKIGTKTYERIGIKSELRINVGSFRTDQLPYLKYHRDMFLG